MKIKREYIEGAILLSAVALAIYLTKKDNILSSAKSKNPIRVGSKASFQNFTEDEITYDDGLYENASGLKGIKI